MIGISSLDERKDIGKKKKDPRFHARISSLIDQFPCVHSYPCTLINWVMSPAAMDGYSRECDLHSGCLQSWHLSSYDHQCLVLLSCLEFGLCGGVRKYYQRAIFFFVA